VDEKLKQLLGTFVHRIYDLRNRSMTNHPFIRKLEGTAPPLLS
jgi:hypothetical protein